MAGEPIKLGSAVASSLIFQTGSTISSTSYGLQQCAVKAFCPDAANVFSFLPSAGDNYSSVFGNSFLPSDFKVDYTDGGPQINYEPGLTATLTILFKRPDPNAANLRKITVSSAIRYAIIHSLDGVTNLVPALSVGFMEPVVTVRYTSSSATLGGENEQPPGTPATTGFPDVPDLVSKYILYNGGSGDLVVAYVNPNWERTHISWDPVAGDSFYDITENWRRRYFIIFGEET